MGAAGRPPGSVRLLNSGEEPAGSTVHRLAQVPDLLERLGGRAGFFPDRAGKTDARPVQVAFGDQLEQGCLQAHHVGSLLARALEGVALERIEHLLGSDLAQPGKIAAVVRILDAQEVAPSLFQKTLDVEVRRNTGEELAAVVGLCARVPETLRRDRKSVV